MRISLSAKGVMGMYYTYSEMHNIYLSSITCLNWLYIYSSDRCDKYFSAAHKFEQKVKDVIAL